MKNANDKFITWTMHTILGAAAIWAVFGINSAQAIFNPGWERPILGAELKLTHGMGSLANTQTLELTMTRRDGSLHSTGFEALVDGKLFKLQTTNVSQNTCGSTIYVASGLSLKSLPASIDDSSMRIASAFADGYGNAPDNDLSLDTGLDTGLDTDTVYGHPGNLNPGTLDKEYAKRLFAGLEPPVTNVAPQALSTADKIVLTLVDHATRKCKDLRPYRWEVSLEDTNAIGNSTGVLEAVGNPKGIMTIQSFISESKR
jgi:hypothetical protein